MESLGSEGFSAAITSELSTTVDPTLCGFDCFLLDVNAEVGDTLSLVVATIGGILQFVTSSLTK